MKIIAFEGIDGCGKTTMLKKVTSILQQHNKTFKVLDFPRYTDSIFGEYIGKFLNGDLRKPDSYSFILWYALDRFDALKKIKETGENFDFLLCNRFTLSSLAFQKIEIWNQIENIENNILCIPIPDRYYVLDIDPSIAVKRNLEKAERVYVNGLDINEKDYNLQEAARNNYLLLSREPAYKNKIQIMNSLHSVDTNAQIIINDLLNLN